VFGIDVVLSAVVTLPSEGNSHVTVELATAEVNRYQNMISGTSCPPSSTTMLPIDSRCTISY